MVKIYRECEQFMEEEEYVLHSDYAALLAQRDMLVEAVKHYTKFHKKPCNCPSCKALAKVKAVVECARNLSSAKHNVDLADEFDDLDLMLEELAALGAKE